MNIGRWTQEEIFILEKLAGTCPLIDIVKAVKRHNRRNKTGIERNRNAVRVKLMRLGLGWQCTEDNMTAYEWSRQLGLSKWRVANWVIEGYLQPRKIAHSQNAISIKEMTELAKSKPHLFSAVEPDILEYFFGEELTKEILRNKNKCYEWKCRTRLIKRTDTGEVVKGVKNLARQLNIDPRTIRAELKRQNGWLVEVQQ